MSGEVAAARAARGEPHARVERALEEGRAGLLAGAQVRAHVDEEKRAALGNAHAERSRRAGARLAVEGARLVEPSVGFTQPSRGAELKRARRAVRRERIDRAQRAHRLRWAVHEADARPREAVALRERVHRDAAPAEVLARPSWRRPRVAEPELLVRLVAEQPEVVPRGDARHRGERLGRQDAARRVVRRVDVERRRARRDRALERLFDVEARLVEAREERHLHGHRAARREDAPRERPIGRGQQDLVAWIEQRLRDDREPAGAAVRHLHELAVDGGSAARAQALDDGVEQHGLALDRRVVVQAYVLARELRLGPHHGGRIEVGVPDLQRVDAPAAGARAGAEVAEDAVREAVGGRRRAGEARHPRRVSRNAAG